jgi:hypothetical protein
MLIFVALIWVVNHCLRQLKCVYFEVPLQSQRPIKGLVFSPYSMHILQVKSLLCGIPSQLFASQSYAV